MSTAASVSRVTAWAVTRRDGRVLGFTDHDRPLTFAGIAFRPETGLTARALVTGTGLAVDNSEGMGALSAAAITAEDIAAGLYDGAGIRMWQVDWQNPALRDLRFAGTLGEIRHQGGAFHAEIRGLSEALSQPQGRVFAKTCAATLGDAACGKDLDHPAYQAAAQVAGHGPAGSLWVTGIEAFAAGWFAHGSLFVLSGESGDQGHGAAEDTHEAQAAVGDTARSLGRALPVRADWLEEGIAGVSPARRMIGLWDVPQGLPPVGSRLRLVAGCDKQLETCRVKFANTANFRGFPHLPGDDWLLAGLQGKLHDN